MKLILSRTQALAATAVVMGLITAVPTRTQTLPPNTIAIERWPEDVPCRVLRKYPDGTWEITVPYTLYQTLHRHTKFKDVEVTRYWDRKCRSATK